MRTWLSPYTGCLLAAIVMISGCATSSPKNVTIHRDFLRDLAAAPSLGAWDAHMYELQYLVEIEDQDAINAGWRALPVILKSEVVYKETDWLALALYDAGPDADSLQGIAELPVEDQALIIRYFDKLCPVDWHDTRRGFLEQKPRLSKLVSAARS